MSDKIKLTLTTSIQAHGNTVTELEFRNLNGEDLVEIGGAPFSIDSRDRTHIDFEGCGQYIVRLAGIPLSSVKMMSPADMMGAFGVIMRFFAKPASPKTSSTGTTNSQGSTEEG